MVAAFAYSGMLALKSALCLVRYGRDCSHAKTWVPEPALLDPIRRAYTLALEDHEAETSVLWSKIIPSKQNAIHTAIVGGRWP